MSITILVPVLNRPQNAQRLISSIERSTIRGYEVLFLCSPGDDAEIKACMETGVAVDVVPFENGPGDWARKINRGFTLTTTDFCLLGADDLRFHDGWDLEALKVARESGAGVIGTNDLGNATVMRGLHSTHPLVRRSYVEEYGTIDEPGLCCHEGYAHQWVDTELVETAKMRHRWAFAKESHVEHMHPLWPDGQGGKKGTMDATYEKGFATSKEDHEHFQQRKALWSRAAMRARA